MQDLNNQISSVDSKVDELSEAVEDLHASWVEAQLEPPDLVDHLYNTAEYVDNEFYEKLKQARARPDQISVLHLRSYDEGLPGQFEKTWEGIGEALHSEDQHPIYDLAKSIVEDIFPKFNAAYQENPDRAYRELRQIVQQYIDVMQNSRLLLQPTE